MKVARVKSGPSEGKYICYFKTYFGFSGSGEFWRSKTQEWRDKEIQFNIDNGKFVSDNLQHAEFYLDADDDGVDDRQLAYENERKADVERYWEVEWVNVTLGVA